MALPIWEGKGEADGHAYWTLNNGKIVGRPYVRRRAVNALARLRRLYSLDDRRATLAATIENDAWMRARNGNTVASVVRDVTEWDA